MNWVPDALGLARPNVSAKLACLVDWRDMHCTREAYDTVLEAEIQGAIADLLS